LLASGKVSNRARLADRLGVSRARVTQLLALLDLDPAVLDAVASMGTSRPAIRVSERDLRSLQRLPSGQQRRWAATVIAVTEGRAGS
jgi:ParB-like chromosome segregation protein Spo0J